jgi:hypothetical protein
MDDAEAALDPGLAVETPSDACSSAQKQTSILRMTLSSAGQPARLASRRLRPREANPSHQTPSTALVGGEGAGRSGEAVAGDRAQVGSQPER